VVEYPSPALTGVHVGARVDYMVFDASFAAVVQLPPRRALLALSGRAHEPRWLQSPTAQTDHELRRMNRFTLLCAASAVLAQACVYDPHDRCDPGQRVEHDLCVCLDGMVPAQVGCEPCGKHETAVKGSCVCDEGYARSAERGACEEVSAELGQSCRPSGSSPECPEAYPMCQPSDFDVGYCTTSGCENDDDCEGGYRCDARETPSYCARMPIGLGKPCSNDDDCADSEATYCVTLMMGGCAVEGCSPPDVGCPVGYACCDLSSVGLAVICVPEGLCPF